MKWGLICLGFLCSCTEAPLLTSTDLNALNNPSTLEKIEGTPYALVVNGNVKLSASNGSVGVINTDTYERLVDTGFLVSSFVGDVDVDESKKLIYVSDRALEQLEIYQYTIPGTNGKAISFEKIKTISTDEGPNRLLFHASTNQVLLSHFVDGTVQFFSGEDQSFEDLNLKEKDKQGLALQSSLNFDLGTTPGIGVSQLVALPASPLVLTTSSRSNLLFVLNAQDRSNEGVISLASLSSAVDVRDVTVDGLNRGFVAHAGLDQVLVLDFSEVKQNGLKEDEIITPLIKAIEVHRDPQQLYLSMDESQLLVLTRTEATLQVIDTQTLEVTQTVNLLGKSPSMMWVDEVNDKIWITNYLSSTLSIYQYSTLTELETLE